MPGEIRALVGENGAGKSTLIKILTGAVMPDTGEVRLEGTALPLGRPLATRDRGVSVVYQEFTLVPDLTVAENVFLGREQGALWLRRADMRQRAQRVLDDLGVALDAGAVVRPLSVAQQQMVEIARALVADARILILDEPSATLSRTEVEQPVSDAAATARGKASGIIYVSHRLDEVFAIADSRDGAPRRPSRRHRAGGDVLPRHAHPAHGRARRRRRISRAPAVARAQLSSRSSTLGAAALHRRVADGSSRRNRRRGWSRRSRADVGGARHRRRAPCHGPRARRRLSGAGSRSPAEAIAQGVGYVTEDRKARGVFPLLGLDENITVTHLARLATRGMLSRSRHRATCGRGDPRLRYPGGRVRHNRPGRSRAATSRRRCWPAISSSRHAC